MQVILLFVFTILKAYLVDTRHKSLYGSVYAIVDISYSLVYAFGPMLAGVILNYLGFMGLSIIICLLILLFVPFLYFLKKIYLNDFSKNNNNNNNSNNNSHAINYNNLNNQVNGNANNGFDDENPRPSNFKVNGNNYMKFQ